MAENQTAELLSRPSVKAMDSILGAPFPVLDKGFIRVVDYMGDEAAITQAARVSYGKGTKTPSDDKGLLRYLMRHHHTTPFEMCEIKLHVKLPIFVARQWIRHRTANVNEYSARYSIMAREFHIPGDDDLAPQSATNKQGRDGSYSKTDAGVIRRTMEEVCNLSFDAYESMSDEDGLALARETAREVLPMSTYTEWYWKVDLHNLLNFLRLRMDPHAQKEIRAYATEIGLLVAQWLPNVWEAFEEYVLGAHTFSATEMKILRHIVGKLSGGMLSSTDLTTRERDAFNKALGLRVKQDG